MIPVALKFGEGAVTRTQTVLLKQSDTVVKLEGGANLEWIYPNADDAGYYRWNLPPAWMSTIAARAATALSPRERMGFGDNLGALLDGGMLHGDAYLKSIESLARDPQPEVVGQAIDAIEKVKRTFVDDALTPVFATWVHATLQPALDRFGAEPRAGEEETVAPLRARLLATLADEGDDRALCARMTEMARRYLDDPKSIDPSLADAVIPIAAIHGDHALFDEYRKRFETAAVPGERARFLTALGEFRDTTIVNELLRYSLTGPLRPQELYRVPRSTQHDEAARDRSFTFVTENYDAIKARVPEMFMGLLPSIGDGCSLERLAAAEAFFSDPKHQGPGWRRQLTEVSESVRDCAALNLRESASVRGYLSGARSAK
jgi:alanyl aminopeptidase